MSKIGYIGGLIDRSSATAQRIEWPAATVYRCTLTDGARESLLAVWGKGLGTFTDGIRTAVVRGYAVGLGVSRAGQPTRVAQAVLDYYRQHGDLPADQLEGSFTLVVTDGEQRRVLVYRNLIGTGFTYYWNKQDEFLFASNLAELVGAIPTAPQPNSDVLPTFFAFRCVPGRFTLFQNVQRLMPGEQVEFGPEGLHVRQRQTLGGLVEGRRIGREAADRLEETIGQVIADCSAIDAQGVNLLSGGVDSTYLQIHWNRQQPWRSDLPPSYSASVDHPLTRREMDYARTAAQALGGHHTFVPVDGPYQDYLYETIRNIGEPPNHVQSAYFAALARAMVDTGITTALCGEGADSLFGLDSAAMIHFAQAARSLVPIRALRRLWAFAASAIGRDSHAQAVLLADHVGDLSHPSHPVNRAAVFAEWSANEACFGTDGIQSSLAYRRSLLAQYEIGDDPMDSLHAIGFLGEAMDSASLWATLFNHQGADLLCPFLDSRVLRLALNLDPTERYPFRKPKELLKQAVSQRIGRHFAYRPKLGFAQPIFEWMAPGGQLRPLVDAIGPHAFVDQATLAKARETPSWFLYSLVCYDVWHKLFIENSDWRRSRTLAAGPTVDVRRAAACG